MSSVFKAVTEVHYAVGRKHLVVAPGKLFELADDTDEARANIAFLKKHEAIVDPSDAEQALYEKEQALVANPVTQNKTTTSVKTSDKTGDKTAKKSSDTPESGDELLEFEGAPKK